MLHNVMINNILLYYQKMKYNVILFRVKKINRENMLYSEIRKINQKEMHILIIFFLLY